MCQAKLIDLAFLRRSSDRLAGTIRVAWPSGMFSTSLRYQKRTIPQRISSFFSTSLHGGFPCSGRLAWTKRVRPPSTILACLGFSCHKGVTYAPWRFPTCLFRRNVSCWTVPPQVVVTICSTCRLELYQVAIPFPAALFLQFFSVPVRLSVY